MNPSLESSPTTFSPETLSETLSSENLHVATLHSEKKFPWLWFFLFLLSGLILFLVREPFRFSIQSSAPIRFEIAKQQVDAGLSSVYTTYDGVIDLVYTQKIHQAGKQDPMFLLSLPQDNPAVFILVSEKDLLHVSESRLFSGQLKALAKITPLQKMLLASKEQGTNDKLVPLQLSAFWSLLPGKLTFPLSLVSQQGKEIKLTESSNLRIDVLFPNEVRVLLKKSEFPSPQLAKQEVEKLGLYHGPAVETESGYGFVIRLPQESEQKERALQKIQTSNHPIELYRIETYRIPAYLIEVNPSTKEIWLRHSYAQKLPIQYKIPSTPTEKGKLPLNLPTAPIIQSLEMIPTQEEKTLIPFEQIQAIYLEKTIDLAKAQVLVVDGSPVTTRLWVWPLFGFCVVIMIRFLFVTTRFVTRKNNDSAL